MSSGWLPQGTASPPTEYGSREVAPHGGHNNIQSPAGSTPSRYSPLASAIVSRVRRPPLERAASVPEQGSRPVRGSGGGGGGGGAGDHQKALSSASSKTSIHGAISPRSHRPPDYNTVVLKSSKLGKLGSGTKLGSGSGGKLDALGCVRGKSDSDGSEIHEIFHNGGGIGSRTSSRGSLDRVLYLRQHNRPRLSLERAPTPPSHLHLMPMDENNIPQIDAAITPPCSPIHHPNMNSTALKGFKRKLPSLKFNKRGRMGSSNGGNTPPGCTTIPINPTITITMNDGIVDDDHYSDHLFPDTNYKTPPSTAIPGGDGNPLGATGSGKDPRSVHSQFIGDDISLYGTPKEELSPLKEVEVQCGTGLLSGNNNKGPPSISPTNYLKDQIISFFQPSDNKLAMKLFGNKNALMKEKMRQKAAGNWVIHPCSNFR
jgi:hypothetical protein